MSKKVTINIENLIGVLNISNTTPEQSEQELKQAVSGMLNNVLKNVADNISTDADTGASNRHKHSSAGCQSMSILYNQNQKNSEHPEFADVFQEGHIKLSIATQFDGQLPDTSVLLSDLKLIKNSVNRNILQAYLVLFHPEILKTDHREFLDYLNSKNQNSLREFVSKKGYHLKMNCNLGEYVLNLRKGISKHLSSSSHYIF